MFQIFEVAFLKGENYVEFSILFFSAKENFPNFHVFKERKFFKIFFGGVQFLREAFLGGESFVSKFDFRFFSYWRGIFLCVFFSGGSHEYYSR